ncbi:MAG TPA: hypothetical protein EYP52_11135 [Anaerolineae bacterium]|nr:hypothetical protein [Anaerolineae bacterium]
MPATGEDRKVKQRFAIAVAVWAIILLLGLFCVWWGFFGPGAEPASPSPSPIPTEPDSLLPLTTATFPVQAIPPTPQSTSTGGDEQPSAATPAPSDQPGQETLTPTPRPTVPPPTDEVFGYGIAADALPLPDYTMGQVKSLGLGWVKQQVQWGDFEQSPGGMDWSGYDAVIDAANQQGLRVMLSVVNAPLWSRSYTDANPEGAPPDDLALFADFLGRLVDRYKGRVHAIEVWNEQNLDREWDTAEGVNPARYVEMLRLAYQAIKSRDPNIIVISGALSPVGATATDPNNPSRIIYMNDRQYFQEMVNLGFLSYADCVGVHHNGYNIPPDVRWNDPYRDDTAVFRGFWDNPDISWSFRSTLEWYNQAVSGMKPLCVTEFGWASAEGLGGAPVGFEFALDNTLEEQAEYDVQAFQLMRQWGFVRLAFLWNLNYANTGPRTPDDPNAPYSLIDYIGAPRPAFFAVQEMEKP